MSNIVTERFIHCHDALKSEGRIKSSRQFALAIGTLPQSLNEVLKGNRDATVKNIMNIVDVFGVNEAFLLSGEEPIFKSDKVSVKEKKQDNITYVQTPAYAGDIDQFHETIRAEDITKFSIPGYMDNFGEHRCFDVEGDSMEPTLFTGDMIVCSRVPLSNDINCIKDKYVYVVITHTDINVKRVVNELSINGSLRLISDNDFYQDRLVPKEDIKEIWRVNLKLSPFMPDPSNVRNSLDQQIKNLETTIDSQAKCIDSLQKAMEKYFAK